MLRDLGCDLGQGYYLSPPLPAEGIAKLLQGQMKQAGLPAPVLARPTLAEVAAPPAASLAPAISLH